MQNKTNTRQQFQIVLNVGQFFNKPLTKYAVCLSKTAAEKMMREFRKARKLGLPGPNPEELSVIPMGTKL